MALAWLLPGEVRADEANAIVLRVADEGALTAGIFRAEVANALLVNVIRHRLSTTEAREAVRRLSALPIVADPESDAASWTTGFDLAERHRLTAYDASFLDVAIRAGLPLATFDLALRRAAAAERVALIA